MTDASDYDMLTVLRAPEHNLAKTVCADGQVRPCDHSKFFDCLPYKVSGIGELSSLLSKMEENPHLAIIRGRPRGPERRGVKRNGATFEDQPLHAAMLDIDDWKPPSGLDPVQDPEACIDAFVEAKLPEPFHCADYWWQLSSSAGTDRAQGKLKVHVWFWLATAYDSASLKAWAKALALPIDPAVFQAVQPHFTAVPIFEECAVDPVPRRSGLRAHDMGRGAVPLVIDAEAPGGASRGAVEPPEGLSAPVVELDTPQAIQSARAYLKRAKPAVQGEGGDNHTIVVANTVGDFGISEGKALELMLEHWNDRCSPPWEPEELQKKIQSARKSRQNPIGIASPEYTFKGVAIEGPKGVGQSAPAFIAEMNQKYAVVRYGADVKVAHFTADGRNVTFMEKRAFFDMLANESVLVGDKQRGKAEAWFAHPARRQHLDPGVVFRPGEDVGPGGINLWRGMGVQARRGDWSLMREHILQIICRGDVEHFAWMLGWMATCVQRLDKPLGVVVALRGVQGSGKGIFVGELGSIFGFEHFLHVLDADQLTGRFNGDLGTALLVFLDEAIFAGDHKGAAVLKGRITEPRLRIERKFCEAINVENRLRIMAATNEQWAAPVEVSDRRYAVFDVSPARAGDHAYFQALADQMNAGGREAMLFDLLAMDLTGFEVRAIPQTDARTDQKVMSLRGVEGWLHEVLATGGFKFEHGWREWADAGCEMPRAAAYEAYVAHVNLRREYRADTLTVWGKELRKILGASIKDCRPGGVRSYIFSPLEDCRTRFARHIGEPNMCWGQGGEE